MRKDPIRTKVDMTMMQRIKTLPAYLKDGRTPAWKKILLAAAVIYTVSPVDAIPDVIPVIGWLDDIGVLGLVISWLMRELDAFAAAGRTVDGRTPVEARAVESLPD